MDYPPHEDRLAGREAIDLGAADQCDVRRTGVRTRNIICGWEDTQRSYRNMRP